MSNWDRAAGFQNIQFSMLPSGNSRWEPPTDDEMPHDDLDPANHVYHEKQESALCLRHALNSLVQQNIFEDTELGEIGCMLDEKERMTLIGGHTTEEDVNAFYKDGYGNVRDDGFFSVEVMLHALEIRGLVAIRYNSTEAQHIRAQPEEQTGYIFNHQSHWFSLRKIGGKWFNLNSTFKKPRQLSNTYVALFIAQSMEEGYTAFVIQGNFPDVANEDLISNLPDRLYVAPNRSGQHRSPRNSSYGTSSSPASSRFFSPFSRPNNPWIDNEANEDSEVELAIQRSLTEK